MATSHVFNSLKMLFNHLARRYGLDPVWFQHEYDGMDRRACDPEERVWMVRWILKFIIVIETRGNLPDKYHEPYIQILNQVLGHRRVTCRELLTDRRAISHARTV